MHFALFGRINQLFFIEIITIKVIYSDFENMNVQESYNFMLF